MAGRGGAGAGSGVGLGAWGAGLAMDAKRNQGRVGAGWFDIMRRGLKRFKDQRLKTKCSRNDERMGTGINDYQNVLI